MLFMICSKHNYGVPVMPWDNFFKIIREHKCARCMLGID